VQVLNKFAGTLESAGREKMKKPSTSSPNVNTFQSPLSSSPALMLINKKVEIEGCSSVFE